MRLILLSFLLLWPHLARADERILDYQVKLQVVESGDLIVQEDIKVQAIGEQIHRGITRNLMARVPGSYNLLHAPVEILAVERDGQSVPYQTKGQFNGLRMNIGEDSAVLPDGTYTYSLRYRIGWQARRLTGKDELYWKVTGHDWSLPIEHARVSVILPPRADILQSAAYVGYLGDKGIAGMDYELSQTSDTTLVAKTLRPLARGEGVTLAVAWPKGVVLAPTQENWWQLLWHHNPALLVGWGGLSALFLYFILAWVSVGRDPRGAVILPIYSPHHSPAVLRYVAKMGFDQETFLAALLNLAVKGYLRIEQRGGATTGLLAQVTSYTSAHYVLVRTTEGHSASADELILDKLLFDRQSEFVLSSTNRKKVQAIIRQYQNSLEGQFGRDHFKHNRLVYGVGLLLSVLIWWALVSLQGGEAFAMGAFMSVWLGFWSIGTGALLVAVFGAWAGVWRGSAWGVVPALFITVFSLPFVGGWVMGAFFMLQAVGVFATIFLVLAALLNVCFYKLLKAPTLQGRGLLDEAEGVKRALVQSEADRQRFFAPPDMPEVFERFLPYAIALDLQSQWTERFRNILGGGEWGGGLTHTPARLGDWYSGAQPLGAALAGGLIGSLAAALRVASGSKSSDSGRGTVKP